MLSDVMEPGEEKETIVSEGRQWTFYMKYLFSGRPVSRWLGQWRRSCSVWVSQALRTQSGTEIYRKGRKKVPDPWSLGSFSGNVWLSLLSGV